MAAAANDVTVKGGGSAAKIFWSWQSDYRWLQAKCRRCETEASIPLDCVRRPRDTPIWKLEASLKCRSCRKDRYAPPVRMIKLTEAREITPYLWVHPDEER